MSEQEDVKKLEETEMEEKLDNDHKQSSPRLARAMAAHNLSFGVPRLDIRRMHQEEKPDMMLQVKQKTINFHRRVTAQGSPSMKIPNFRKLSDAKNTKRIANTTNMKS